MLVVKFFGKNIILQSIDRRELRKRWHGDFFKATLAVLITTAVLFVLSLVAPIFAGLKWADPVEQFFDSYQFTDLFFRMHRHADAPIADGRQVVVVDISDYHSREEIAGVLSDVADAKPYCVALDIVFAPIADSDPVANRMLEDAVSRLPNLVLAKVARPQSDGGWEYDRSFFADRLQAQEGIANFPASVVREWNQYQIFGTDTLPSFNYLIAKHASGVLPADDAPCLIDYSIVDTLIVNPHRMTDMAYLENQIVIVGDVKDLRDLHLIPVSLQSRSKQTGVLIHRQIIDTILAGNRFVEIHTAWFWVIAFVFLWLSHLCSTMINGYVELTVKDEDLQEAISDMADVFAQALVVILLFAFAYILFWHWHLYFDLGYMLGFVALLWLGKYIVRLISNKRNKK